jgi:predicted nucleic acid-binding protein
LPSKISIDTGVLVEFVDEAGDFHSGATIVLNGVNSGKAVGLIAHPVLAELYYVSAGLYEKLAGAGSPVKTEGHSTTGEKSEGLIKWLFTSPNFLCPENSLELAIAAGSIKKKYGLVLTDSYVIAAAQLNKCRAVFRSPEEEMSRGNKMARMKKEEAVEVVFLRDYT